MDRILSNRYLLELLKIEFILFFINFNDQSIQRPDLMEFVFVLTMAYEKLIAIYMISLSLSLSLSLYIYIYIYIYAAKYND